MAKQPMACSVCGYVGSTRTVTPGSFLIELILWIAFLIPGLIYSIWRHGARHEVCAACGNRALVPLGTPAGQEILRRQQQQ